MCRGTVKHYSYGHVWVSVANITPIRSYWIIICFNDTTWYFNRTSFLPILTLLFDSFRWKSRQFNKEIMHTLVYMKHSQQHITLYQADIFFGSDDRMLCSLESLMMILLYSSLDSLITPYANGLNMLLWSYTTNTCDINFGTNCVSEWPPIYNVRQSFDIGEWTTWGRCRIQL